MKRHLHLVTLLVAAVLVISSLALIGCSGEKESPGEALVNEKCMQCHSLSVVEDVPPGADWDQIIQMMIDVYKAPITADEKAVMVEYLGSK